MYAKQRFVIVFNTITKITSSSAVQAQKENHPKTLDIMGRTLKPREKITENSSDTKRKSPKHSPDKIKINKTFITQNGDKAHREVHISSLEGLWGIFGTIYGDH